MTRLLCLPVLALFASTSIAATVPVDQKQTAPLSAQDSANGSMTNTDLSGHVDQDTSALSSGTTSGTTQGAIIDHTSKKKSKKKKKKHQTEETMETTESGTTSSGDYGNEDSAMSTEGRTPNDDLSRGVNGKASQLPSDVHEQSSPNGQSSTGGM